MAAAAVPLSGEAFSALIGAHAALRQEDEAAALAGEAVRKGVPLSAEAYLAALSSVRSPAGLREVVAAMQGAPRFAWLGAYSNAASSSLIALGGAVTGKGRVVPALQSATALEVRAGLQAASMLESGFGGVTALLGDLQASSVAVDSVSRCTLLAAALLEGDLQRLLVLSLWLPLLSPHGEALLDALGPSLTFARAPGGSSFGEVWCFDWRGAETHPALTAWLRHRATFDERFDGKGGAAGLCPVDVGVFVLEGLLLALSLGARLQEGEAAAAAPEGSGGGGGLGSVLGGIGAAFDRSFSPLRTEEAAAQPVVVPQLAPPAQVASQLRQLKSALQGLIGLYETRGGSGKGGGKGLSKKGGGGGSGGGGSGVAFGSLGSVPRALLTAVDLQQGLRYGAQLQSAKVLVVALDQLLSELGPRPPPARPPRRRRGAGGVAGEAEGQGADEAGAARLRGPRARRAPRPRRRRPVAAADDGGDGGDRGAAAEQGRGVGSSQNSQSQLQNAPTLVRRDRRRRRGMRHLPPSS